MQKVTGLLIPFCLVILALNCSSTQSPKTFLLQEQSKFNFGKCNDAQKLVRVISNTFYRHGYDLLGSSQMLETDWRYDHPTEADLINGIAELRYKLVISLTSHRKISEAALKINYLAIDKTGQWIKSFLRPELLHTIKTMQTEVIQELQRFTIQW